VAAVEVIPVYENVPAVPVRFETTDSHAPPCRLLVVVIQYVQASEDSHSMEL